jgi:hypothetical protein
MYTRTSKTKDGGKDRTEEKMERRGNILLNEENYITSYTSHSQQILSYNSMTPCSSQLVFTLS